MRVTMTGATGFIGGHTAALAVEAGHEVRTLVRSTERLEHTMAGFDLPVPDHVVGDMTDPAAVAAALDGADAVIHCAAVVSLDPRDSAEMIDKNAAGARTVLEQAVEMGLDPVVHVSSTAASSSPTPGRSPSTTRRRRSTSRTAERSRRQRSRPEGSRRPALPWRSCTQRCDRARGGHGVRRDRRGHGQIHRQRRHTHPQRCGLGHRRPRSWPPSSSPFSNRARGRDGSCAAATSSTWTVSRASTANSPVEGSPSHRSRPQRCGAWAACLTRSGESCRSTPR